MQPSKADGKEPPPWQPSSLVAPTLQQGRLQGCACWAQVRQQVREQEARERLQAIRSYGTFLPAPFPAALTLPLHAGGPLGYANGSSTGHLPAEQPLPALTD